MPSGYTPGVGQSNFFYGFTAFPSAQALNWLRGGKEEEDKRPWMRH